MIRTSWWRNTEYHITATRPFFGTTTIETVKRNHDSPAQEEGVQGRAGRQKASRAVDDARSETLRSQRDIGSVLESVDTPGTLQVLGATIDGTRSYRRDRKNHWRRWHSAGSSERYIVTDVPLPRCPHRLDL